MGWPKLLVFVRHGESEGNVLSVDERAKFECGTNAYPLTERGRRQAKITGEYLRNRFGKFDVYYTSYYCRTHETLEIMYPEAHVYEDSRLAESQRGIWNALTNQEMHERHPDEVMRKAREGLYHYRPPGGENWPDIELRVHSFLGTIARDLSGKKVLIVGHGFWMIIFQRLIHHFSVKKALEMYKGGVFENTSVTIYRGKRKPWPFGKSHLILEEQNIVPWEGKL